MPYQPKTPPIARFNPRREKHRPSRFAMIMQASVKSEADTDDVGAQKKARLMLLCGMPLHFTENIPEGHSAIIDPAEIPEEDRADCPFSVKTLVLRADEIDRAIAEFTKPVGLAN